MVGVLLLCALLVVAPIVASSFGIGPATSGDAEAFEEDRAEGPAHTVAPHPNSTMAIWPFTSRSESVDGATLPINVVVLADVDLVRSTLIHRPDARWEDQTQGLNTSESNSNEDERTAQNASDGSPNSSVIWSGSLPIAEAGTLNSNVDQRTLSPNATEDTQNASDDGSTLSPDGSEGTSNATESTFTPTETATPTETTAPQQDDGNSLFPTAANSTGVYWSDASGSDRYTYVKDVERGDGRWIAEAGQLHDGDYFGTRYHIRFYDVSDGEDSWTALQVHREHFDWFRLRHTVGSLPSAQHYVETQFYDRWYISELHRQRFTRGGILNADGWATVVEIKYDEVLRESIGVMSIVAGLVLGSVIGVGSVIGGWTPPIDRRDVREVTEAVPVDFRLVLMAGAIAAIPLFVRSGSLAVERAEIVGNADVIAGAFYPLLALGLPVCAYVLARGLGAQQAFTGAVGGLGFGILLDYTFLGITVLPIQLIVHRAFLLVALGVVAVAGTDRPEGSRVDVRNPTLLVGVVLWIAGLLWTLFFW